MTDKLVVLVENKNEYLEHLTDISTIPICKFFVNIANNCSSLKEFQNELVLLTKWNKQKQDAKMNTIHKLIEEDHATPQYMLKLLSEIISKSIKIKIIEHKSIIKSLKVYIPEWYEFLYKVCILASNIFWKNPVLFYKKVSSIERQNNINVIEKITKTCIKNAVRSFIPLNKIINELTDITGGGEINITNTQTLLENKTKNDTNEKLDSNDDEDDDNDTEEDDEQLEANDDTEEDDEPLEANDDTEEDDEQLEANDDTEEDDEPLEANGDTEEDEDVQYRYKVAGDYLDDTKESDNTEYAGNKNIYSIKKSKIDDEIVRPGVILEKTKKTLKDEIVKTEEALKDEIIKPIAVLEKPEEALEDEIVRPIAVLEKPEEALEDEIVRPIAVLEKPEEALEDEIVIKPITVLEKPEEALEDEIVKPITVLEKPEEALEDEIVIKPITVLEKPEEALEDEIVKPITVLEKPEEALEDEIVIKPITVLEKPEEALKDDDDEIVMNNKDIKVIRINKSFF